MLATDIGITWGNNKMKKQSSFAGLFTVLVSFLIQPVQGQENTEQETYEPILEEILVTARKRSENLQDVPISIVAMNGEKMRAADINKLEELQTYVPNLQVTETGIGTNLSIRGIGSGENQGFEQSVGTYVDGIYHGRAQQSRIPFLDVERVEVLRGPQSTLFGKNSIAGALNISTAMPTDTLTAQGRLLYEPDFDEIKLDAYISGPLSSSFSGRLAVHWRDVDGFMENLTLDRDEAQREERALRGTLTWYATDTLDVTLKLETSTFDVTGRNLEIVEDRPAVIGPFAGLTYSQILQVFGQDESVKNNFQDYRRSSNGDLSENEVSEFVLTLNYQAPGDHTLTSITGYSTYEYEEFCDCDFTGGNVFNAFFSEDFNQFSQEVRLSSPTGQKLEYLVGLYYQTSKLDFFDTLQVNNASILVPIVDALAGPGLGQFVADTGTPRTLDQETDSFALFGELTWSIGDRTRLTFGGRLSKDKKKAERILTITDINGDPLPPETEIYTLGLYAGLFNVTNHDVKGSRNESNFMPSFVAQYDMTDSSMVYLSLSRGYKSGGFDARSNNAPENGGAFEFDEETADSYELGFKMALAGGAADLNVAFFNTDYEDLQISTFDGVLGFNVVNAARAVTRGIEIDGRWLATDHFMINGSFAWTDFEFKDYQGQCWFGRPPDADDGINCDYSGQTNLLVPKYSGVLSGVYSNTFSNDLGLSATLDLLYSDEYLLTPNLDPRLVQDSYIRLNGRLALLMPKGNWEIALIGKNLTNESILNFGNDVPLAGSNFYTPGFFAFVEQPRTLALQATWTY
jgi:iron complex outermembrane receptor protein